MTLLVGSIFHMTRKIVSEMTYNVSMGTLNPTIPIPIDVHLLSVVIQYTHRVGFVIARLFQVVVEFIDKTN